ncbi:MAG: hypothetical protein RL095_1376 [Verrucomicrobiota bacterium]|jgi:Ca-activated chloride channel family protein
MTLGFHHPWLLALLVIPLAGIFRAFLAKGHLVVIPFDHAGQGKGRRAQVILSLFACAPWLLLACALLIAAGPVRRGIPAQEREVKNILFCLDVSGSMNAPLGDKRRFDHAVIALNSFCQTREGDSFGLTVFGSEFWHWIPVTADTQALAQSAALLDPKKMPDWFGGTSIAKAVEGCRQQLIKQKDGDRIVILVSDGDSSDISGGSADPLVRQLKDNKITVHGVFIGAGSPGPDFARFCTNTGGLCYAAADPRALKDVFRRIDAAETSRFKSLVPQEEDNFAPFALAGLVALLLCLIQLLGLRYTPW